MADPRRIRRALISVYDKTGIVDFARALHEEFGIQIISTGGTAKLLEENDIPVTLVEEITGFPEMLDGRVKTLHPKIHAAILADRDNPEHMGQLAEQGIEPIDLVVVNLYPFEQTIAKPDCTFDEAIEMIDIGGPCLLRAAAKNAKQVWVVTKPSSYDSHLAELGDWDSAKFRNIALGFGAARAFNATCAYDAAIMKWLTTDPESGQIGYQALLLEFVWKLRYGENPHQSAFLHSWPGSSLLEEWSAQAFQAKSEPSFNNYTDASAALDLCTELTRAVALCGTGFQPVSSASGERPHPGFRPLDDEKHTRRNLPHIQTPGKTYFVTFRLRQGDSLNPEERTIVLDACRFWAGEKIDLHAVVVMPDHVHMLFTPLEIAHGQWATLGEILHSVKRHSARQINKLRGGTGPLWLDESFDRIMRNEQEFVEKADYIANNPLKKGLAEDHNYQWWWDEEWHRHRLQTGATPGSAHRLETGAAPGPIHRLDTGATPKPLACVFIKHTNACGAGVAADPIEAYRRAYFGDPKAAMGGILACDFAITPEFAEAVMDTYGRWGKDAGAGGFFVEVWLAPSFEDEAVKVVLARKKWGERVRLLAVGDMGEPPSPDEMDFKHIAGGVLMQNRDLVGLNEDQWKVVTKREPTEEEMNDLRLAWLVCKHTKSNAVTICKDGMLIGNGAGQMSRVMSCRIATWLAAENGHKDKLPGSVAASDAFFPFCDGPDILMEAGVTALIQPGGSKRDQQTIDACNERGAAMIFTGTRHFKH